MDPEDEQQQQSSETPDEQQQSSDKAPPATGGGDANSTTKSQTSQTQSPDELRAEIARMQKALKDANKEAEQRRKRLQELETAEETRRRESQSEVERLQEDHRKAVAELETLRTEQKRQRVLTAAQKRAASLSLHFHDGAIDDALRLGLLELDEGDDGKINGIDAALRELAKERPYYLKGAQQQETDATKRGNGGGPDVSSLARRFGLPL